MATLLSEALMKKDLSQGELARIAHVSTKTISDILREKRLRKKPLRKSVIIKLALALGENPEDWIIKSGQSITEVTKSEIRSERKIFVCRKIGEKGGSAALYSVAHHLEIASLELEGAMQVLDKMVSSQPEMQKENVFRETLIEQAKNLKGSIKIYHDDLNVVLTDVQDVMKVLMSV